MGNRHGRVRVHRRNVSLLRCAAGNRSASAGGRLHLRLSTTSGSVARWFDEITGKNFGPKRPEGPSTAISRETGRRADMSTTRGHSERSAAKSKNPAVKPNGNAPGFDSVATRSLPPPACSSMSRLPQPLHSRLRRDDVVVLWL